MEKVILGHKYLAFLLIFILVLVILQSFLAAYLRKDISLEKYKLQSITMILAHVQLVLGLILFCDKAFAIENWGIVMGDSGSRFTYVEHPFAMFFAVVFISVGKVKAKKIEDSIQSAKTIFTYFTIALVLLLMTVPYDKLLEF